ncbi:MAG: hypothetical protein ACKN9T_13200 [Candidatus Methylumidiphilus sp.]
MSNLKLTTEEKIIQTDQIEELLGIYALVAKCAARVNVSTSYLDSPERMALQGGYDKLCAELDSALISVFRSRAVVQGQISPYQTLEDLRADTLAIDEKLKEVGEVIAMSKTGCDMLFSLRLMLISAHRTFERIVTSPSFRWKIGAGGDRQRRV